MIQVRSLTKIFPAGPKAVDGLDLSVPQGEILGLLGPNGAGKTTTIRALSSLCGFDSGEVIVAGYDVDKKPEKVRQAIGVVAQNTGIDYFLTGREEDKTRKRTSQKRPPPGTTNHPRTNLGPASRTGQATTPTMIGRPSRKSGPASTDKRSADSAHRNNTRI